MATEAPPYEPAMMYFVDAWRGDEDLAMVSDSARLLWHELLLVMHTVPAPWKGHLVLKNGKPLSARQIAIAARMADDVVRDALEELADLRIYSVTDEDHELGAGVIYSRRMVRDVERREKKRAAGKKGGEASAAKREDTDTQAKKKREPTGSESVGRPGASVETSPRAGSSAGGADHVAGFEVAVEPRPARGAHPKAGAQAEPAPDAAAPASPIAQAVASVVGRARAAADARAGVTVDAGAPAQPSAQASAQAQAKRSDPIRSDPDPSEAKSSAHPERGRAREAPPGEDAVERLHGVVMVLYDELLVRDAGWPERPPWRDDEALVRDIEAFRRVVNALEGATEEAFWRDVVENLARSDFVARRLAQGAEWVSWWGTFHDASKVRAAASGLWVDDNPRDDAVAAWDYALAMARGRVEVSPPTEARVKAALDAVGGIGGIRRAPEKQLGALRAEFITTHVNGPSRAQRRAG